MGDLSSSRKSRELDGDEGGFEGKFGYNGRFALRSFKAAAHQVRVEYLLSQVKSPERDDVRKDSASDSREEGIASEEQLGYQPLAHAGEDTQR